MTIFAASRFRREIASSFLDRAAVEVRHPVIEEVVGLRLVWVAPVATITSASCASS